MVWHQFQRAGVPQILYPQKMGSVQPGTITPTETCAVHFVCHCRHAHLDPVVRNGYHIAWTSRSSILTHAVTELTLFHCSLRLSKYNLSNWWYVATNQCRRPSRFEVVQLRNSPHAIDSRSHWWGVVKTGSNAPVMSVGVPSRWGSRSP